MKVVDAHEGTQRNRGYVSQRVVAYSQDLGAVPIDHLAAVDALRVVELRKRGCDAGETNQAEMGTDE